MIQGILARRQEGRHTGENTPEDRRSTTNVPIKIEVCDLNVFYRHVHVLHNFNISIPASTITAFVGPSGSGKSTFLRSLNRLHDLTATVQVTGNIFLDGDDITQF